MKKLFALAFLVAAFQVQAASVVSDYFYNELASGTVVIGTDTFYCTLHTSSITPSKTWQYASSLTNEVPGTGGYTTGGHACTVSLASVDTTSHRVDINVASHNWTTSTISAAHYVCIRKRRGGALSADEFYGCFDFGADISTTAGTFTVNAMTPASRIQN